MSTALPSASMDRRRFLTTTAMGVTAVALANKSVFAAASGESSPLLSIGFAPALPAIGASVRLADAASLYLPDPAFITRGARVVVAGSARGAKHTGEPGGVGVDAVMPMLGRAAAAYPHFRFWSAAGESISGKLSFTMPVLATTGLTFVARRVKQSSKKEETSATAPADVDPTPFTLSLGSAAGPKLQRGVYVVALRESASDVLTDWSRFSIVAGQNSFSIAGAELAWVILQIDYAARLQ